MIVTSLVCLFFSFFHPFFEDCNFNSSVAVRKIKNGHVVLSVIKSKGIEKERFATRIS